VPPEPPALAPAEPDARLLSRVIGLLSA